MTIIIHILSAVKFIKEYTMTNNYAEIYLAGGCFWGTEHFIKQIKGVTETQAGYANGKTETPLIRTYAIRAPGTLRPLGSFMTRL